MNKINANFLVKPWPYCTCLLTLSTLSKLSKMVDSNLKLIRSVSRNDWQRKQTIRCLRKLDKHIHVIFTTSIYFIECTSNQWYIPHEPVYSPWKHDQKPIRYTVLYMHILISLPLSMPSVIKLKPRCPICFMPLGMIVKRLT